MCKFLFAAAACGVLLGLAPWVTAQEPSEIIDKAIKAHGGLEKLSKLQGKETQSKAKGTLHQFGGIEFTMETFTRGQDKLRIVMDMEIAGMKVTTIQVLNGNDFWINVNGKTLDNVFDEKALAAIKEQIYSERLAALIFLKDKDKNLEFASLGELKLDGKDIVGLSVSSKGHKDVSLWFDKTTGLLAKVEHPAVDPMGGAEKKQTKIFKEYKAEDGYKYPVKVAILQDEQKYLDVEILEVKFADKLDDSLFSKP